MEVIVKPGKEKHPDHPNRDPLRKKMEAQGQYRLKTGKMKFADELEKREYEKAVAANPHNVPGFPAYYPPLRIAPSHGIGDGKPTETLPCGHRWVRVRLLASGEKRYVCPCGGDYPAIVLDPEWQKNPTPLVIASGCPKPLHTRN